MQVFGEGGDSEQNGKFWRLKMGKIIYQIPEVIEYVAYTLFGKAKRPWSIAMSIKNMFLISLRDEAFKAL